jgi:hypothetical protein
LDDFLLRANFATQRYERVIVSGHPIQGSGVPADNSLISVLFDLQNFLLRTVVRSSSSLLALSAN